MKQSKLRRKRVFRYATLYFLLFIVFVGLIAGPVIVGNQGLLPEDLGDTLTIGNMYLMQPTGLDNDNTQGEKETGTGAPDYSGVYTPTSAAEDAEESEAANRIRLF